MAKDATNPKLVDVPQRAPAEGSLATATPAGGAECIATSAPVTLAGRAAPPVKRGRRIRRSHRADSEQQIISPAWRLLAPIMAGALMVTGLNAFTLPHWSAVLLAAIAVIITSFSGRFPELDSDHAAPAAIAVCVVLPLFCFGCSLAEWADGGPDHTWLAAICGMIVVGTVASVLLSGRLGQIVLANIALWGGPAVVAQSLVGFGMLGTGVLVGIVAMRRQAEIDLEARMRHEELEHAQLRAEELLAEYEQTGQGWFWETDRRGMISYVSSTICDALSRPLEAVVGRPFTELFVLDAEGQEGERTLNFHLSARSSFQDLGVRAAVRGEEERWWSISGRPIHDNFDNFLGFRGSGSDLTEKRRSQEKATRLAHYDSLTSLANRFQMSQTLEKILNAQRLEHRACAVFLLDLDRFKQVNDTMGHPAGDSLLTQVAKRLERTVDAAGRVGRLGGDEFQVIVPGGIDRDVLAGLAQRIIESLSQPYSIEGHSVVIGVSIGIAVSPDDGVTSEALIRNADLALYAAKDGGRGRHHFYAPDLHSDAEERRQLEQDLREALASGGLELYYQPVVHTTTEKITGFEALLRWTHPQLGPLSPAKFIPIAEDTGLIAPIGEWALRTACQDLARWPENVRVAVNVSPLQFNNPSLPAIVTSALAAAQVEPSRLELEITESVFLNDDVGTDAMFTALKRIGVRLSLDDFGTGYSALGYLKKAPFDKIKIDQSFVRGATKRGSRNGAIISSIVSLAEALGMETTAEGVETLDELDLMRMLGCSHIQGYIYEKPLNATAATERLHSGLIAIAQGPRAARAHRQTMLRKVALDQSGERYIGTIRNMSATGAMIEGLWNVPPQTVFTIHFDEQQSVVATARWCQQDRMGVEFATQLQLDDGGRFVAAARPSLRKSGEALLLKKLG